MSAAADHLRRHVQALPERHRTPWHTEYEGANDVFAEQVNAWIAEASFEADAALIALVASPDVVTALAELLDRLTDDRLEQYAAVMREVPGRDATKALLQLSSLSDARDALERAILRGGGHAGG